MLLYFFILCFLSIFIALGHGKQFAKPESEIRFGWRLSFIYIGQLHHNLDKYDVVVGLQFLISGQTHITNHSLLTHTIVENGTVILAEYCMTLAVKFGQLT